MHSVVGHETAGARAAQEWLFDEDNKGAMYRYFRRYLQLLSYRYKPESHWVLKAPLHSLYIKALVREFPDARIINTHRDPKDIIASWTKFQFQMVCAGQPRFQNHPSCNVHEPALTRARSGWRGTATTTAVDLP